MARDALLDRLTRNVLPADVREACLRSLGHQLHRAADAEHRQAFRFLLLHAARIARHRGSATVARRLTALALERVHGEDGWITEPGVLEVMPPWPTQPPVSLHTSLDSSTPVDQGIDEAMEHLGDIDAGPDLETKFRFTGLSRETDHSLAIMLASTTWHQTSRFTSALQRDPGLMRHAADGAWIQPVPLGTTALPTIAVVHGIVLTSDDRVLLAQRSMRARYAPSHWSVSFEEQLNEHDIGADVDPFTSAACRGFREEFGAQLPSDRVVPLSAFLQIDLLNVGIVMLLRPRLTAGQIQRSWRAGPPDGWEAQDLRSLPLTEVGKLSLRGVPEFTPLHVTSSLRGSLLLRWIAINR